MKSYFASGNGSGMDGIVDVRYRPIADIRRETVSWRCVEGSKAEIGVNRALGFGFRDRRLRPFAGVVRIAVSIALGLLLVACGGESETYRYRMTVYVDTPAGPRSGSSVIEVVSSPPDPMGSSHADARGEAVAVDLPGGTLFALLRRPTSPDGAGLYAEYAYGGALPNGDWRLRIEALKRQAQPALLPREELPMLVRFRDPADARTIEVLSPSDLAAGFGSGIRFSRVVIQVTNDPVSETIVSRLPSFRPGSGYAEWIRSLDVNDPRRLSIQDFRSGF